MRYTHVNIFWQTATSLNSIICQRHKVLYAIIDKATKEILYLGKADKQSVKERLQCESKQRIWEQLDDRHPFQSNDLLVIVGVMDFEVGRRFSSDLLSDIESMLILGIKPRTNDKCKNTRKTREGVWVACSGYWHFSFNEFYDAGQKEITEKPPYSEAYLNSIMSRNGN